MQGTPLESGWITPIDASTVQVEMRASSSLASLYAGNVYNLGKLFNILLIANTQRVIYGGPVHTQLFTVTLPTS
jgi:hypothetical protein